MNFIEQRMPMKEWFRHLRPLQLYIILFLTIVFFIAELTVSHITHSFTLLMDSYHTLCNILALVTCMIAIKYGKDSSPESTKSAPPGEDGSASLSIIDPSLCSDKIHAVSSLQETNQEKKLKNTFGWARLDVIGMLACCVCLASLCFSIFTEALQTLGHIGHHDEMHHPIPVLCTGAMGILLNGICYLLIGGYTFHQGSFLYMTETGCVVLNRVVTNDLVSRGGRRLSRTRTVPFPQYKQRQGCREMLRDIVSCIFVIICALVVYFTEKDVAKYVDPGLCLLSAIALVILSYPYMKESCLILLQTIPDTINIDSLQTQLLEHFPDIVNVHDLHVWQLTATKVISTVHIIFRNPKVYAQITDRLTNFFLEQGITQVTIQPEFFTKTKSRESIASTNSLQLCLMKCQSDGCKTSHCCPDYETSNSKWKSIPIELDSIDSPVILKYVKIDSDESPTLSNDAHENEEAPESNVNEYIQNTDISNNQKQTDSSQTAINVNS